MYFLRHSRPPLMNSLLNKLFSAALLICCARTFAAEDKLALNPPPHVVVVGGVPSPGAIPYAADLTVMSAIQIASGMGAFGGTRVYLIRESKSTKIDVRELVKDLKKDPLLKPWDIVFVPN